MDELAVFKENDIGTIENAATLAEELVSDFYKMSANQWLKRRYDIKTLADLKQKEIVHGPFAQIIRYEAQPKDAHLGSSTYDFYKICLQDHSILSALENDPSLSLFPFSLYIISHELIHIVRFSRFQQNFHASPDEKMREEKRVHLKTHEILESVQVPGMAPVFEFYQKWRAPLEIEMESPNKYM
jgi:hypothetical protein